MGKRSSRGQTGFVAGGGVSRLIGGPLVRDLARELGRPVRLMNDPDCFALSEASDGAGAGAGCVFVARNRHGDSSGVRGAAWLWPLPRRGAGDATGGR